MRFDILTLFPDMFGPVLETSILGRAAKGGHADYHLHDIRDFADNKHRKVDDRPFGGGPGMVMMCHPLYECVQQVERQVNMEATRILLTPQGELLTQQRVENLASLPRLLLIAGHYEGVDERVIDELSPLEISMGDFVVSGGELPALMLVDAVVRLLPGVLGHADSAAEDSFSLRHMTGTTLKGDIPGADEQRLLDCPHYTRPQIWKDRAVPKVLLSGDHGAVDQWRMDRMIERTHQRRPDILKDRDP